MTLGEAEGDDARSAPVWRVRAATVELLRYLDAGEPIGDDSASVDRANRLLAAYVREIFGRDLPTARWVFNDRRADDGRPPAFRRTSQE